MIAEQLKFWTYFQLSFVGIKCFEINSLTEPSSYIGEMNENFQHRVRNDFPLRDYRKAGNWGGGQMVKYRIISKQGPLCRGHCVGAIDFDLKTDFRIFL